MNVLAPRMHSIAWHTVYVSSVAQVHMRRTFISLWNCDDKDRYNQHRSALSQAAGTSAVKGPPVYRQ